MFRFMFCAMMGWMCFTSGGLRENSWPSGRGLSYGPKISERKAEAFRTTLGRASDSARLRRKHTRSAEGRRSLGEVGAGARTHRAVFRGARGTSILGGGGSKKYIRRYSPGLPAGRPPPGYPPAHPHPPPPPGGYPPPGQGPPGGSPLPAGASPLPSPLPPEGAQNPVSRVPPGRVQNTSKIGVF